MGAGTAQTLARGVPGLPALGMVRLGDDCAELPERSQQILMALPHAVISIQGVASIPG